MTELEGRVAVITGAGGGLGRAHALYFAAHGAKVVVNDVGSATDGTGADGSAAQQVVDEIVASGGEAVANTDSVADWAGAQRLIHTAVDAFGDLHVLVNNAGIMRNRMLVSMEESDWDAVVDVNLKGSFCTLRHAASYWRQQSKHLGRPVRASVVCTASGAGLFNAGTVNYGAAKAGVAALAQIAAKELARYGVRVNTIAPLARTRLAAVVPALDEFVKAPENETFDAYDPANVSPLVAYLSTEGCELTGSVWHVAGGQIGLIEGWRVVSGINRSERLTMEHLRKEVPELIREAALHTDKLVSEAQPVELVPSALTAT